VTEDHPALKVLIDKLLKRLHNQFSSYYDIFRDFPEHFDHVFLGIVRAGETTGNLGDNILQYIAEREKMLAQRKLVQEVFWKRGILLLVVLVVAMVIVVFVIPQFAKLLEKGGDLPGLLAFLLGFSRFLKIYGLTMLFVTGGFATLVGFLWKYSYPVRKIIDKMSVKIPLLGEIIRTFYTCNYLYFTGTLLLKNVSYLRIMDILIEQTNHIPFREVFTIIKKNITLGVPINELFRRSEHNLPTFYQKIPRGYLLPSLSQALEMGSATGNMGQVLCDAYASYEIILHQKIQRAIKIFDRIFYAGIVVLMGILFLALGMSMMSLYNKAGTMIN